MLRRRSLRRFSSPRAGWRRRRRRSRFPTSFPAARIEEGDFRDRLCRRFAAEVEKRTNGAVAGQVYPNSSLMKTVAQFSAMRKGALDISLYPISYAGGEYAGSSTSG